MFIYWSSIYFHFEFCFFFFFFGGLVDIGGDVVVWIGAFVVLVGFAALNAVVIRSAVVVVVAVVVPVVILVITVISVVTVPWPTSIVITLILRIADRKKIKIKLLSFLQNCFIFYFWGFCKSILYRSYSTYYFTEVNKKSKPLCL